MEAVGAILILIGLVLVIATYTKTTGTIVEALLNG